MAKVYFYSDYCGWCDETNVAVAQYNRANPFSQIQVVDMEGPFVGVWEDFIVELQEKKGEDFQTPCIVLQDETRDVVLWGECSRHEIVEILEPGDPENGNGDDDEL